MVENVIKWNGKSLKMLVSATPSIYWGICFKPSQKNFLPLFLMHKCTFVILWEILLHFPKAETSTCWWLGALIIVAWRSCHSPFIFLVDRMDGRIFNQTFFTAVMIGCQKRQSLLLLVLLKMLPTGTMETGSGANNNWEYLNLVLLNRNSHLNIL